MTKGIKAIVISNGFALFIQVTHANRLNQFDKIYERIVNVGLTLHKSLPPLPFQRKRGKEKKADRP